MVVAVIFEVILILIALEEVKQEIRGLRNDLKKYNQNK